MVAKPIMRGFTARGFKRDMIGTVILATVAVVAHRLLVVNPRRQKYADFYKTYDAEADFQRMRKAGLFQSCSPDDD